jgi:hypothetical protein
VEGSCEHGDEPSGSLKLLGISFSVSLMFTMVSRDSAVGIATDYGLDD